MQRKKKANSTPRNDAVQLIASMIEPYDGTLYDPCCGIPVECLFRVRNWLNLNRDVLTESTSTVKRKNLQTYRLAKMNLALRGISHHLGEEADSSFTHDLHKGLYFDYIMAEATF